MDRGTLGSAQHRNDLVLLRWALRLGLGFRQRFNRRPQLLDQCVAISDFPPLFDTWQSIPQRQQSLAAEPGCMQLLARSDCNFALIHCSRRLAAEGDSVIANDVDAHRWVLLVEPAQWRAGDQHSRSLRRPKPLSSG